jgi:hypothetical protein
MAFTPIRVRETMLGQTDADDLAFDGAWQVVFSDSGAVNRFFCGRQYL